MSTHQNELFAHIKHNLGTSPTDDSEAIKNIVPAIWVGCHGLIYAGLQAALKLSKFHLVACIDCMQNIEEHASRLPPRFLLIIDASRSPKLLAGGAEIQCLREAYPEAVFAVIVGGHFAPADVLAFRAANVIISHDASSEQLINVLDIAMDGIAVLPITSSDAMPVGDGGCREVEASVALAEAPTSPPHRPLSDREIVILQHLSVGNSNKSIARSLSITESTVKLHVKGILRKISASNRTQAAVWALTNLKQADQRSSSSGYPEAMGLTD